MLKILRHKIKRRFSFQSGLVRFVRNKDGIVSIEFALIMPVFIATFFSALELTNYVMVDRRAGYAVTYHAELMTRLPSNRVISRDLFQGESVFAMVNTSSNPNYKRDPNYYTLRGHEAVIASVDMERIDPSCEGKDCKFNPVMVWHYGRPYHLGRQLKPFGCSVSVTPESMGPESDTIPESDAGRSPLVMARLAYEYHPIIFRGVVKNRFHKKSGIRHVRDDEPIRHNFTGIYCRGQR